MLFVFHSSNRGRLRRARCRVARLLTAFIPSARLARSIRSPSRGHVAGPLSSLPFHTRQVERSISLLAPHTVGSRSPTASSPSPPARGRCAVPTLAAIGEVLAPVYAQEGPALQPAPPGRSVLVPPATSWCVNSCAPSGAVDPTSCHSLPISALLSCNSKFQHTTVV